MQAIIKHQYKVKGLQSTLFAATPDHFAKQTGERYQLTNTAPTSGGSHWILLMTKNHAQNKHEFIPVINIYDSLGATTLTDTTLAAIDSIMQAPKACCKLDARFMKCDRQSNFDDCGVHFDLARITYLDPSSMRQHLIHCLEMKSFTPFPYVLLNDNEEESIATQTIIHTEPPAPSQTNSTPSTSHSDPHIGPHFHPIYHLLSISPHQKNPPQLLPAGRLKASHQSNRHYRYVQSDNYSSYQLILSLHCYYCY